MPNLTRRINQIYHSSLPFFFILVSSFSLSSKYLKNFSLNNFFSFSLSESFHVFSFLSTTMITNEITIKLKLNMIIYNKKEFSSLSTTEFLFN